MLLLFLLLGFFCLLKENLSLKQQQQQQQQVLLKIGNITNYITFPPAKTFFWMRLNPYPKGLCLFFSVRTICVVQSPVFSPRVKICFLDSHYLDIHRGLLFKII